MDNKLFVGNLTWDATEEDVRQYFAKFGNVQQVEVMRDRFTNRARGFAFVTFATGEEAQNAVNNTEGREFQGRPLKVNVARPREENSGGERRSYDAPRGGGGDRGGFRPRRPFNSFNNGGDRRGGNDRPRRRSFDRDRGGNNDRSGFESGGGYSDY
ncbi:MAG: RNA-binding protein [Puniceicoccales bacterium]|jgi:RNA recognition motif-containing protein|nr:RNA-binding protein [Puniceicoccales bacterium]